MRGDAISEAGRGDRNSARIELFGGLKVWHGDTMLPLAGQRQLCLLAVLLLNQGRTVSTGELADWAWPSTPPETVSRQIPNYLSGLRRVLAPVCDLVRLESRRPGYSALIDPQRLDTAYFGALIHQGRDALAGHEPQVAAERIRAALALWRGHPLDGLETPYLARQMLRLEAERRDASLLLAEIELGNGDTTQAIALLRDLVSRHPDDDAVTTLLVRALTSAGQGTEAADLASRAERALISHGRTPSATLRKAHSDALAGRSSAATVPAAGARRQLPADTGAFTGRERELAELVRLAKQANTGNSPGTVLICAVDGMAGVGKTALAVHAGHRVLELFPDGQLTVDLHGYTQNAPPRDPAEVLAVLLRSLGVPAAQIPDGLDGRAALYRDRLAGTRTLILLDNAANESQVRPLLPADDKCLVLVTSRRRLKALDDAHVLPLDVLPVTDATALFRHVAGPGRIPANDPLLDEILTLCGRLPVALRIAAALLRNRPTWPLHRLVDTLRPTPSTLHALTDGSRDLTAVFDLSYCTLTTPQQKAYRHLGLMPGSDIDAYAATALLDADPAGAEHVLQELADHNLLMETEPGRYRMHDLIRTHAQAATCPEPDREAAVIRLLDYYQQAAQRASAHITRTPRPQAVSSPPPPAHVPDLPDPEAARAWLRAERANLDAAFDHALHHSHNQQVIMLAAGVAQIMIFDGPWARAVHVHEAAVTAARNLGNRLGQAVALADLGRVRQLSGNYSGASDALTQALALFRELGNRLGQAVALADLARVRQLIRDYSGASDALTQALALFRELGNRLGQAGALAELGRVRRLTGDHTSAVDTLTQALQTYIELGNRHGQANALTDLGVAQMTVGDFTGAADALTQALGLSRDLGNRHGQANALSELGALRQLIGDCPGAIDALTQALDIYRDLGDRTDEASVLNRYAAAVAATGDITHALALYGDALRMNRELAKPHGKALSLEGIGECLLTSNCTDEGIAYLNQALEIFQRFGMHADAERVRARLDPDRFGGQFGRRE